VRAQGNASGGGRFRPRIVEILAERTSRRLARPVILLIVFDRSATASLWLPYLVQGIDFVRVDAGER